MNSIHLLEFAPILAIVGFTIGIATAYLRLYVRNELLMFKQELMREFDHKYVQRRQPDDDNRIGS